MSVAAKMNALTGPTTEKCKDALATVIADVIAEECPDDDIEVAKRHAHHMMIAVIASLFASMIEGVLDGDTPPNVVAATDKMITKVVGPQLVKLHKEANRS